MSSIKFVLCAAFISLPLASQAAPIRNITNEELATKVVAAAVIENDLRFETTPVENICGNTGLAGTDVKVQIQAGDRVVTLRHYGVQHRGLFREEKPIDCAKSESSAP